MGWNDRVRRVGPVQEIPRPAVLGAHIARDQASRPQESRLPGGARHAGRPCPRVHRCGLRASGSMKKTAQAAAATCASVCARSWPNMQTFAVLKEFMTKLGNAYEDLFRFVLDPRIPSTNNAAERGAARDSGAQEDTRDPSGQRTRCGGSGNLFSCVADMAAARHRPSRRDRKMRLDGASTYGWRSAIFLPQFLFQLPLPAHQLVQLLLFDVNLLFEFKVFRSSFFVQFFVI